MTCPNRYEHLMFFDPLAISDIIKKSRIFSRKNKKYTNKKRYLLVLNIYMEQKCQLQWILDMSFQKWLYVYDGPQIGCNKYLEII